MLHLQSKELLFRKCFPTKVKEKSRRYTKILYVYLLPMKEAYWRQNKMKQSLLIPEVKEDDPWKEQIVKFSTILCVDHSSLNQHNRILWTRDTRYRLHSYSTLFYSLELMHVKALPNNAIKQETNRKTGQGKWDIHNLKFWKITSVFFNSSHFYIFKALWLINQFSKHPRILKKCDTSLV